jgi:hypothetical protein
MNKFMLFMTFISLGFLTVISTINPDASVVWLASPAQSFDILLSGVMVVLLVLMFTNPPRNVLLRTIVGISAIALTGWSGYMAYEGAIQILDGLILLAAGITSLIAVLEFEPEDAFAKPIVSHNYKSSLKAKHS